MEFRRFVETRGRKQRLVEGEEIEALMVVVLKWLSQNRVACCSSWRRAYTAQTRSRACSSWIVSGGTRVEERVARSVFVDSSIDAGFSCSSM